MKAKKYKIEVSEGVIAHVHGMTYEIEEVYIPELELYINKETAFIGDDSRVQKEYEEIEVNGGLAKLLQVSLKEKESSEKRLREELGLQKD